MTHRTTGYVSRLPPAHVFVFGSNEAGRHGAGAARTAQQWGARYGAPEGPQGQTYAIPTKPSNVRDRLSKEQIAIYVERFVAYAATHPELTFLVTEIGCGLADYHPADIAPLFQRAINLENVHLPASFWGVLKP